MRIYLDYNASTPIADEVANTMRIFFDEHFGNPSSRHWASERAKAAIEAARRQVAELLGCDPAEIVFTSGGTESNNAAIKGVFFKDQPSGHIVTTAIEHPAVLAPCRFLEHLGVAVTKVGVDSTGMVDPDDIKKAIRPDTRFVSVMHANNEVGTIQPIEAISKITRERGILFHTDAAQSVGKIPARVDVLGVDLLSIAGHKLYAPKGVGALYIRKGVVLEPFMHGAGHESGRRAGTENAMSITGLGKACELATKWATSWQIRQTCDYFWERMKGTLGDRVALNGHATQRLPNTLSVSFPGRIGAEVLAKLEGVAASTGSACHSGRVELSNVLKAMGIYPNVGMGAIRFSLGRSTTRDEVDAVIELLKRAL